MPFWSWRESIAGKVSAFHVPDPGLNPGITYSLMCTPKVIPDRAKCSHCVFVDVTQNIKTYIKSKKGDISFSIPSPLFEFSIYLNIWLKIANFLHLYFETLMIWSDLILNLIINKRKYPFETAYSWLRLMSTDSTRYPF